MDIIEFVSSINKIAIISFVVTLAFLIYEITMMRREKVVQKQPTIPQFDPTKPQTAPSGSGTIPMPPPAQKVEAKPKSGFHKFIFPTLIIMLVLFGAISIWGLILPKSTPAPVTPLQTVQQVKSSGIKIYDSRWKEIPEDSTDILLEGDLLYIGVVSIRGADIDMARIKINESTWMPQHTTTKYSPTFNIYYREYVIESTNTQLSIEAQLHSKKDGWLSE